jgi:hypothetical protein
MIYFSVWKDLRGIKGHEIHIELANDTHVF